MPKDDFDTFTNFLSTGAIVGIVISSIITFALCIGFIVMIVCIIKHCSGPRHSRTQGIILQQPYPYPHSWTTQYPSNTTSVSNHPPSYQSLPPPYTASAMDSTKPSIYIKNCFFFVDE